MLFLFSRAKVRSFSTIFLVYSFISREVLGDDSIRAHVCDPNLKSALKELTLLLLHKKFYIRKPYLN